MPIFTFAQDVEMADLLHENGKIYVAQNNYKYLGAIDYPEKTGKACSYNPKALYLKGHIAKTGLPAFASHYFRLAEIIEPGNSFVRNIEFVTGQAVIETKSYKQLDDILLFLKKNPNTTLQAIG